ncbi:hypothetical protein [Nonomuraea sp. 10N515B]|uniref:hypothetical protein n=1 Tax=Nonomuraea sp. 10N515B TaxID=3457422 RepID=UPI003FCD8377
MPLELVLVQPALRHTPPQADDAGQHHEVEYGDEHQEQHGHDLRDQAADMAESADARAGVARRERDDVREVERR